jgi:hypothetical protein
MREAFHRRRLLLHDEVTVLSHVRFDQRSDTSRLLPRHEPEVDGRARHRRHGVGRLGLYPAAGNSAEVEGRQHDPVHETCVLGFGVREQQLATQSSIGRRRRRDSRTLGRRWDLDVVVEPVD